MAVLRLKRRRPATSGAEMTVVEHLEELRDRLLKSLLAFFAGSVIAYLFYERLLDFLIAPLDKGGRIGGVTVDGLNVGGIATGFLVRLKVSIFFGLAIALPVILWQLWRFIVPGLRPKEKRYGVYFVAGSVGLFALGAFVAFLVLPQALGFLLSFADKPLKPLIMVDQYLSFISFLVLAFGLSFEFPLLLILLAGLGMVSSQRLRGWRRQAAFGAFVIAAVATPSQDPFSMILMAVPLYILYEASLLVIRFGMKK